MDKKKFDCLKMAIITLSSKTSPSDAKIHQGFSLKLLYNLEKAFKALNSSYSRIRKTLIMDG